MVYLIETLIYLIAIFGIIFTSISFYEMCDLKKYVNNTYRVFSKNSINTDRKIEVIVKIKGLNELEEDKLIEYISDSESINLKEISDDIIIQKDD